MKRSHRPLVIGLAVAGALAAMPWRAPAAQRVTRTSGIELRPGLVITTSVRVVPRTYRLAPGAKAGLAPPGTPAHPAPHHPLPPPAPPHTPPPPPPPPAVPPSGGGAAQPARIKADLAGRGRPDQEEAQA